MISYRSATVDFHGVLVFNPNSGEYIEHVLASIINQDINIAMGLIPYVVPLLVN